jgi:hypothetical protein
VLLLIAGLIMLGGSIALLQHFRVAKGEASQLGEAVETSLAILVTAGVGGGIICTIAGVSKFLT